jgi:hypothetical protein
MTTPALRVHQQCRVLVDDDRSGDLLARLRAHEAAR